jgi:hypothetical protein
MKLSLLRMSIKEGYLDLENRNGELIKTAHGYAAFSGDCQEIDGSYYHSEKDEDEFIYDDFNDEYILSCESVSVITGRRGFMSIAHENNRDIFEISGDYYTRDGARENGFVQLHDGDWCDEDDACYVESEGDYYHQNDCFWNDRTNEYQLEEPNNGELFECSFSDYVDKSTMETKIGFEVEKEDSSILENLHAPDLLDATDWAAVSDGSLGSGGFELVSPIFDLHGTNFCAEFSEVKKYLNADFSENCGGHINYSSELETPKKMAESISGYLPLLYAMYPKRIQKRWCIMKPKNELLESSDKYQAVCMKRNRIEFRIFPAVKNLEQLVWRAELIKIFDLNRCESESEVLSTICDPGSDLNKHLRKVYTDLEKFTAMVQRVVFHIVNVEKIEVNELETIKKLEQCA